MSGCTQLLFISHQDNTTNNFIVHRKYSILETSDRVNYYKRDLLTFYCIANALACLMYTTIYIQSIIKFDPY